MTGETEADRRRRELLARIGEHTRVTVRIATTDELADLKRRAAAKRPWTPTRDAEPEAAA